MPLDLILALSGLGAGAFGAALGLGGGLLIVPVLTLGFGIPLPTAVGTSLVCVIATSTGAAGINVRAGRADVRLGINLAAGTVIGAVTGGLIAGLMPERATAALFALLLGYTAFNMVRGALHPRSGDESSIGVEPTAPDGPDAPTYRRTRLPLAIGGSFLAGNVSGLLGVGGGIIGVPLVHLVMGAPLRVAVATSNFMIGITAAAGAYVYVFRGDIDLRLAAPVVLGVTVGAALGAVLSARVNTRVLSAIFVLVLGYVAIRMLSLAASG